MKSKTTKTTYSIATINSPGDMTRLIDVACKGRPVMLHDARGVPCAAIIGFEDAEEAQDWVLLNSPRGKASIQRGLADAAAGRVASLDDFEQQMETAGTGTVPGEESASSTVREIRRDLAVSQLELARILDIPHGTIRNWEGGHREPTGPALILLRLLQTNSTLVIEMLKKGRTTSAKKVKR